MKQFKLVTLVIFLFIIYTGCNPKSDPKVGAVVFNIPTLLNKNIDEIISIIDKHTVLYEPKNYKDSYCHFKKDGWELLVCYNIKTRSVIFFNYYSDFVVYNKLDFRYDELNNLLVIGNLIAVSKNYYVTFGDGWSEFSVNDPSLKYQDIYGVTIYPKYKKR